jgi:HSP20 family protein
MAAFSRISESQRETSFVRFQSSGWQVNGKTYSWSPPTDVFETDKYLIIKIEIAGMKQSDISINIEDNYLVVSGTRKESIERRAYHQMEIRFGDFNATIELPKGLALENSEADYEDGFLTISIPYTKATTIQIKG